MKSVHHLVDHVTFDHFGYLSKGACGVSYAVQHPARRWLMNYFPGFVPPRWMMR